MRDSGGRRKYLWHSSSVVYTMSGGRAERGQTRQERQFAVLWRAGGSWNGELEGRNSATKKIAGDGG